MRHWLFTLLLFPLLTVNCYANAVADPVTAAVQNSERSAADRSADAYRNPEASLKFLGIKPGQTVLDFFAGTGYYTEILSRLVGSKGHVDAYNNRAYHDWVGRELDARMLDNRLPNVSLIREEVDALQLKANQYDAIFLVMALHDTYYADPANGWPLIDRSRLLQLLKQSLKPGGILAVIDHAAKPGTGADDTQRLHRIDEAFLVKELQNAGFKLLGHSEVLRNAHDDRSLSSFDNAIRYHTDRFLLKFRKSK